MAETYQIRIAVARNIGGYYWYSSLYSRPSIWIYDGATEGQSSKESIETFKLQGRYPRY